MQMLQKLHQMLCCSAANQTVQLEMSVLRNVFQTFVLENSNQRLVRTLSGNVAIFKGVNLFINRGAALK